MINIDALNDEEKLAALESIHKSIAESKEIQRKKITTNVEMIVKALKKIEADLKQRYDETGQLIANLKSGEDGRDGKDGKDGKNGKDGRDGPMGPRGYDGVPGRNGLDGTDGVSVTDAHIDFDGSLIIHLSSGRVINVGEVVSADIAEKIKVITNGGGTSQSVLDAIANLQAQINAFTGGLDYQGTWNANTNTPTLASSVGTNGEYYVVSTAGSTNLNGVTDWQIGDWAIFNGSTWQKLDQTNLVTSVAGRTGAIVLTTADIGGLGTIATQNASNVSITGGSITGITDLAIADGGTGASTAAAAITALTGTQTSGFYLRSNGTGAFLSSIQAADVPTLNQNTTGSAATLSMTNPVSRGGTNLTSLTNKGVLYASSTSQVATGTALQFDGNNLGVSTTPSAWSANHRAIEIGDQTSVSFYSSGATKVSTFATNIYNVSTIGARDYYKANGVAAAYIQSIGEHAWLTAPSGTAGSTTTIVSGNTYTNLTAGNQPDFGASDGLVGTIWTATSSGTLSSGTVVQNINFVESMRIDTSSNVGIGTSFPGSRLDVKGTLRLSGSTSGYVGFAPASAAGSTTYTLPSADGTNGQTLTTNGSGTLSWATAASGSVTSVAMTVPAFLSVTGSPITSSGTLAVSLSGTALPIANGGTGQTTANAALNALLPSQTGNGNKYLQTNGTDTSWDAVSLSTSDITGTLGTGNGGTGLTAFTLNGVVYATSTSALATGNALQFDGTNLLVGTTTSVYNNAGRSCIELNGSSDSLIAFKSGGTSSGYLVGGSATLSLYAAGASTVLTFGTNGQERLRINASGNVGIGVSLSDWGSGQRALQTPAGAIWNFNNANMSVVQNLYSDGAEKYVANGFASAYNQNSGQHVWSTAPNNTSGAGALLTRTPVMTLDASGNLGIGTTSPVSKLDILGSSTPYIRVRDATGALNIGIDTASSNVAFFNSKNSMKFLVADGSIQAVTVDSSGNLGIGTTSPAVKLDIAGTSTTQVRVQMSGQADMRIISDTGYGALSLESNMPLLFRTNATERARIDSSGTFRVKGAGTAGSTDAVQFSGSAPASAMSLDSSGNLLVGTTTGQSSRIVSDAGTSSAFWGKTTASATSVSVTWNAATTGDNSFDLFYTETSPSLRGSISYNRAAGLTSYSTTSDYRAKDISGPITDSGALIDSVPVYMGKMKGATQERPMFIAHETPVYAHTGEKDAVDADGNPVYQQMDASALIPVMWAEIQSLRKRLADAGI